MESLGQLVAVVARGGRHGYSNNRRREFDRLQHNGMFAAANGVARSRLSQADDSTHLTGLEPFDCLTIVGVHFE